MPAVRGLHSLVGIARSDLAAGRKVQVAGASETLSQLFTMALATLETGRSVVVVLPTAKELAAWSHFVEATLVGPAGALGRRGAVLPYFSCYGNDRFVSPKAARSQRLYALSLLAWQPEASIVVTTLPALAQTTLAPGVLRANSLRLQEGQELDQDQLIAALEDLGYLPAAATNEEGHFTVRGGIVDVFPLNCEAPLRLEVTFDTLTSIRVFGVADQRSKATLAEALIVPAYEALTPAATRKEDGQRLFNALLDQGVNAADRDGIMSQFQRGLKFAGFEMFTPLLRPGEATGLDYLGAESVLLFPAPMETCLGRLADQQAAVADSWQKDQERRRPGLPPARHFAAPELLAERLGAHPAVIEFGNPLADPGVDLCRLEGRWTIQGAPSTGSVGAELFDKWLALIEGILRDGGTVFVLALHDEQIERLVNLLGHRGLGPEVEVEGALPRLIRDDFSPGRVYVGRGELSSHLWLDERAVLVLSEQALFGARPRQARSSSQKLKNYLSSFADLKVGDLVVHVQHGIGCYRGLTSLSVAGLVSDFLVIEYAGGDKIYLPVDRLSLLQRYSVGSEGGAGIHPVDKLGGSFERRKGRVKGAVREMADELLKLQASRAVAKGLAFGPPDDTYLKFEAMFPYEETEDQIKALGDVEADLRSGRPMDRLICGDVGFGKTEVALRAVMRTVLEGYQALVLVPTTVLSYQHFRTFHERLSPHGVRVAQVNRFVKGADVKEAVAGLEKGVVDVLIGTHRMLSNDIRPRRLGLLVIDEEQRFGVGHKEKLKGFRSGAHVMTLTATPIPRTLHMSMLGLRDISIIATPPQDRLSVKTFVAEHDDTLIKDAIEQEVRRGGQVFFVHNRVEDIEATRLHLTKLVPGLEVRIGHGQMPEHQLERVIVDFLEQKFPILLCTTIIESGVDMPHVNTLIVDRADRYGLAQLYQLRGRVGRSSLQAYAYFLTPVAERLSDESKKRLEVLAAHQELGAGFQIASHDLELRGAGNLLGARQSGHAAEVGLELYTELLEQAIHELRGEPVKERIDTEIRLPISALIPATYVANETQRLHLYKSLFAAEDEEDLRGLRQEIVDRFGPPPLECQLLFKVARLKQQLRRMGAQRLTAGKGVFELRFAALAPAQADRILEVVRRQPDRYRLAPDHRLMLRHEFPEKPDIGAQEALLTALTALIDPLV